MIIDTADLSGLTTDQLEDARGILYQEIRARQVAEEAPLIADLAAASYAMAITGKDPYKADPPVEWQPLPAGWPLGAHVTHAGHTWGSTTRLNRAEPGVDDPDHTSWKPDTPDDETADSDTDTADGDPSRDAVATPTA